MSELEAWNWLKNCNEYKLVKSGDYYILTIPGDVARGKSVIDCVIQLKK